MPFHFRVATAEDIPAIALLIAASVRELQPDYSPAEREAASKTVFTVDSRLIADGTYFVAVTEDGSLAGCGGWSRRKTLFGGDHHIGSIEPNLLDPAVDAAKVRAIFIHPQFARQGLGSELLRMAEEAASAEGYCRYEMGSTLAGVALYRLKGYSPVRQILVPVGMGETIAVVQMVKERESRDAHPSAYGSGTKDDATR